MYIVRPVARFRVGGGGGGRCKVSFMDSRVPRSFAKPWRTNGVLLYSSAQMKCYRLFLYVNYSWIMHIADYTALSIGRLFLLSGKTESYM